MASASCCNIYQACWARKRGLELWTQEAQAGHSAILVIKILPVEIIKTNCCHFQTNVGDILRLNINLQIKSQKEKKKQKTNNKSSYRPRSKDYLTYHKKLMASSTFLEKKNHKFCWFKIFCIYCCIIIHLQYKKLVLFPTVERESYF